MGKSFCVVILGLMILGFNGCATTRSSDREELEKMQRHVFELETELKRQKEKNQMLQRELSCDKDRTTESSSLPGGKLTKNKEISKEAVKQIQTALRNAGYYTGTVDGIIGPRTKKAIKTFQKKHGLIADGEVGNKTWFKLSKYLYKK
ncbi:MAG: peptidoglycan-binding protein [Candidatus Omnitrophota bacterium]